MTRVEQVLNNRKQLFKDMLEAVLSAYENNRPLARRILQEALPVLQDIEAYELLNDIRKEHVYLIDSNEGHIIPVSFS